MKQDDEIEVLQSHLDSTSFKLVSAINRANSLGVQLDLIRDELKRIRARILESKFSDDPHLSNIVDYCTRSQEDIASTYSVIAERDELLKRITAYKIALDQCRGVLTAILNSCAAPDPSVRESLLKMSPLKEVVSALSAIDASEDLI